jgi:hypothetical protein
MKDRPWRKIFRRESHWEEKSSETRRTYSWSATEVHTLYLECGHKQVRRGSGCPTTKVICKECESGKPTIPLTVEPGVYRSPQRIQDPIARALLPGTE